MIDAEQLTRRWLRDCVLGLELCPFAAPVLRDGSLRVAVSQSGDVQSRLRDFLLELDGLQSSPEQEISTTLLVFECGPWRFAEFLELLEDCQDLLERSGMEGILQLAHFHPDYLFAGEAPESLSHYTNRSPYPTLHLIREAMISRVLENFPSPEDIPRRNIARLESLGESGIAGLWGPLLAEAHTAA